MIEIVSVLSRDGDISGSHKEPLPERVPHLEIPPHQHGTITKSAIFTHLWPDMLPDQIWRKSTKIILVVRNPSAAIVSMYHFGQHMPLSQGRFRGTWHSYFEYAIGENVSYGNWFSHVKKWWEHSPKANVHIVTYENLSRDLKGCIEKMAKFMNKDLSDATIDAIAKHVTFESMKNNPMTNYNTFPMLDNDAMMRVGKVDDWKNYFTVAQKEKFDEIYRKQIQDESELGNFLNKNVFFR